MFEKLQMGIIKENFHNETWVSVSEEPTISYQLWFLKKTHKHAGKIPKCEVGEGDKNIIKVSGFKGRLGRKSITVWL